MKLKTKFTLLVSILVAIFALTAFFAFSDYKKSIQETIAHQQFLMISALADEIDSKLLTAQQDLIAVAKIAPPDIMQKPEKAQAFFDNRPILHKMFDNNVVLFTPSGKIFVESPYISGTRGFDLSSREFITNTMKTSKPYISDPYVSTKPPKNPVVILTVPLFDAKGKITGILGGSFDLISDNFLGKLSNVKIGETGYLYLIASDRTLIMHPDKKRILTKMAPGLNSLFDKAIGGFDGTGETTTSYGIRMLASSKHLKVKDWILLANFPQAEAYHPIHVAERYLTIVTFIGCIAALISIFLITKYFIRPIELFTRHVGDIPQRLGGDRFLNTQTNDEIGTLATAFNQMVKEIDKRSELELSLETLRQSEERFHLAMEASKDGIWDWNVKTDEIYYSPGYAAMLGYTSNEIPGHVNSWMELMHPEDRESALKATIACIENRCDTFSVEFRMKAKNGEWRWILRRGKTVSRDISGRAIRMIGTHTDATERKKAEEDIRKSKQQYDKLVSQIPIGTYVLHSTPAETFTLDYVSPRMAEMLNLSVESLLADAQIVFQAIHPDDRDSFVKLNLEGIRQRRPFDWEGRIPIEGKVKWLHINSLPESIENGDVLWYGIVDDVSERKQAEQDKATLEAQLYQSQKMESIGILAGGVAHDFNNILMAIISYGYMTKEMLKDNTTARSYIEEILDSANRASELTRGLLAFSRKQVIAPVLVDLNEIVRKIEMMLGRIIGEDIKLSTVLSTRELPVLVDTGQMEQVLINLATNARDAMPDGGDLVIKTAAVHVDSHYSEAHFFQRADEYAVLTISDTGVGMDQGTKENIFEPFFTTKEVGKGTGLGLSIAYGIIKQHNGNIRVYSEARQGTTFKIYLPMAEEGRETIFEPKIETPPEGKGETIMVAEDEPQVRKSMRLILQCNGYKIIEAENGEDAVKKFQENRSAVSLILMDVIMPVKNGREAYEKIKSIEPSVKTIFMSGYTDDIVTKKGLLEEGFDLISKPINPDTLIRKIRDVLDR